MGNGRRSERGVGARETPAGAGNEIDEFSVFLSNLIETGTGIAAAVSACFVTPGAFLDITAGGSPRRVEAARATIANTLTGLPIVPLARVVPLPAQGAVA